MLFDLFTIKHHSNSCIVLEEQHFGTEIEIIHEHRNFVGNYGKFALVIEFRKSPLYIDGTHTDKEYLDALRYLRNAIYAGKKICILDNNPDDYCVSDSTEWAYRHHIMIKKIEGALNIALTKKL